MNDIYTDNYTFDKKKKKRDEFTREMIRSRRIGDRSARESRVVHI